MCPDQKSTRGVDSITLMLCLFFRAKRNGKLLAPKQLYLGIKIEQETERAICIALLDWRFSTQDGQRGQAAAL